MMPHDNYICQTCRQINPDVPLTMDPDTVRAIREMEGLDDPVNHPKHYNSHPSGIEAITICEHYNFNVGNAIKYLWRSDLKGDDIEQLSKAKWYIEREIERRTKK